MSSNRKEARGKSEQEKKETSTYSSLAALHRPSWHTYCSRGSVFKKFKTSASKANMEKLSGQSDFPKNETLPAEKTSTEKVKPASEKTEDQPSPISPKAVKVHLPPTPSSSNGD